ncbi:MAG: tetratricopeptide repeat protein [Tenuifilaceae bacterium]|nr:tetratricopeptide repeat protein [Tenuifilaceae bacterium]
MKFCKFIPLVLGLFISTISLSQNLSQAISLFKNLEYDEATKIFYKVTENQSQYAESRYYLGQIEMGKQNYGKAQEYLQQAISSNKEVAKYHSTLVTVYLQQMAGASMLKQMSLASKLKTHMEEAVRLNPNDMNSSLMLVGFYKQAPSIMGGGVSKADELAKSIFNRSKAEGYLAQAIIAQMDKDVDKAIQCYKKSIEASPDSLRYKYSLAQFYLSQSQTQKALAVVEQALQSHPSSRELLLQIGRFYAISDVKDNDKGVKVLKSFIDSSKSKPDFALADAYYYLGLIEKKKENTQQANAHFKYALSVNPYHKGSKKELDKL